MADQGLSALDLSLEFDEKKVLEDNLNYLVNTLEMEGVDVKFSSEASEKIQEDCRPGNTVEIENLIFQLETIGAFLIALWFVLIQSCFCRKNDVTCYDCR